MSATRSFSLVRRIIGLVVAVSIVTLVLHSMLLVYFLQPLADEIVFRMATQVRSAAAALSAVPAEQRDAVAASMRRAGLGIERLAPVAEDKSFDMLPAPLRDRIKETLGPDTISASSGDEAGNIVLTTSVRVDAETWWITFAGPRPPAGATVAPVITSVAVIAIAAIGALVGGVRLITRPMSRLAQEMLDRRDVLRRIDEPERSSVELRGLIRSFNALVHALELSTRSRRQLLAGVSHDLRTPLSRLRLRVETECSDELAERMEPDFLALGRIVDQFLAYAQGEDRAAGVMRPLGEVVTEIVAQHRAGCHDVRLLRAQGAVIDVPDLSIQRALSNLIDNARAYAPGPVEVELTTEGDATLLVVYDRGRGIAEEDLEQAMQPFVRLKPAPAQDGHCGLGLAIVGQVAAQLGGKAIRRGWDGRRSGMGMSLPIRSSAALPRVPRPEAVSDAA